jgi:hypothetical protein
VTPFAIGAGGQLRHLSPYLGLNAEHILVDPDGVEKRRRQKVVPHLSYEDPFEAVAWLCGVFKFTEVKRFDRGEDNLTARLKAPDGGAVMISATTTISSRGCANGHRTSRRERGGPGHC